MKSLHGGHFTAASLLVVLPLLAQGQVLIAASSTYTIQDLGTLGGTYSEGFGINASGQVVGDAATASGSGHAFLYSGGVMFDLSLPGTSATARSINASGQIGGYYYDGSYQGYVDTNGQITDVGNLGALYSATYAINSSGKACGSSMTSSNNEHAFLWSGGVMTDINPFGGSYSAAADINTSGQVVGYGYLTSGDFHAFVRTGTVSKDLGTLGGDWSLANAITDSGKVVGQAYLSGNVKAHAFLWNGSGALKDLGQLPGGNYSEAFAVNSTATQIVGRASVPDPQFIVYHAFLYANGKIKDLNNLIPRGSGWVLSEAAGINDAGKIVGTGTIHGQQHAFLLTPR
jgi:probable HAF family extracellular repeat protein